MAKKAEGRIGKVTRQTRETRVRVELELDRFQSGESSVETGIGFLDHMLDLLAHHAVIRLRVVAEGDLDVDPHHTVEDVGIAMGQALDQALGDKASIARYGSAMIPMDETLASVAVDLSGRAAFVFNVPFRGEFIGRFPVELIEEFLKAFAFNARMNLHVNVHYGSNNHHMAEAVFKGLARCLREAKTVFWFEGGIPSTKGSL